MGFGRTHAQQKNDTIAAEPIFLGWSSNWPSSVAGLKTFYERFGNENDVFFFQEDEDKEEEIHSGSEAGEEEEVDVVTVERIPALCSR